MPRAAYRAAKWREGGALLTDSKQMTASARERWEKEARAMEQEGKLRIAVASRSAAMIDRCGIAPCIRSCVASALRRLGLDPKDCEVLLDGSLSAPKEYAHQTTVIRGDSVHKIISLASVVAKVRRDAQMTRLAAQHPHYGWEENKGYGTAAHYRGIAKSGLTPLHRNTFLNRYLTQ